MSFLFGSNDPEVNCECHKNLKDHLKKCADYGKRPPLLEKGQCPPEMLECNNKKKKGEDECGNDQDEKERVYLKPFVPVCEVPPTATFTCPAGSCADKSKEEECNCGKQSGQGISSGSGGSGGYGKGNSGKGQRSGNADEANCCEPKPLKW